MPPDGTFRFVSEDTEGHSGGYEVIDVQGRRWDVKIGEEAQVELVASRVLWAIGFHQPVTYYVSEWRMSGGPTEHPPPGRFRLDSDHETKGDWPWRKNPFSGTRELRGLLVVNILLNNWDLDKGQNRIYAMDDDVPGPRRRYVVQDLGAALGKPRFKAGTRNDVAGYEQSKFVTGVSGEHVHLALQWRHPRLRSQVTIGDVVWVCRLLAAVTVALGLWMTVEALGGHHDAHAPGWLLPLSLGLAVGGIALGWSAYQRGVPDPRRLGALVPLSVIGAAARRRYGLDALYAGLYRAVLLGFSRVIGWLDRYVVDGVLNVVSAWTLRGGDVVRRVQTGLAQDYVYGVALGILLLLIWAQWGTP